MFFSPLFLLIWFWIFVRNVYCLSQTLNSNLSQVSESVNFIEKVSPYRARPEVEMDPKRVFSTQHWLHTCRLPKVKFFIKRAIGVIPNRYVEISFTHIWSLFAHRIVFSSRNIQTTGPDCPKEISMKSLKEMYLLILSRYYYW